MNAAIRAVTRSAIYNGLSVKGIYRGYKGLVTGEIKEFKSQNVSNIIQLGGTILKTARCKEFTTPEGRQIAYDNMKKEGIDALVIIVSLHKSLTCLVSGCRELSTMTFMEQIPLSATTPR
jgi:6-phosphofructokinase 1